jgi:tRNA modification GTPase
MADTIFALASARGKAGVAVVRISGDRAHQAASALVGDLPPMRSAGLRAVRGGAEVLDRALVLAFAEGESFTGEAVVELHLHGSPAVVSAVLDELARQPGLRGAEAGEFTRRALENGRLDLAQVEGLADLIEAETEAQRRLAMRVFSGDLGRKAAAWRAGLIEAAALLGVMIDFADEDVPEDTVADVRRVIAPVLASLRAESAGYRWAERVRDGFVVAILGAPNTGKSTLLNRLAGRDAAITSAIAGTTRDVIAVEMDVGGYAVTLLDTAGLRETVDPIEVEGIARALRRAEDADVRIVLTEKGVLPPQVLGRADDIVLEAKADLAGVARPGISGKTGEGVAALLTVLEARFAAAVPSDQAVSRARHKLAVDSAIAALDEVLVGLDNGQPVEVVAGMVNEAIARLGTIVGVVGVDDVLDVIFGSFCIGK